MGFSGFSPAALAFFEGLAVDNSKGYWEANRAVYDREVKAAMTDLLDALGDLGPFRIFRPYNDVRFAKGRPPYKEQIAAIGETEGGAVLYVAFAASGLTAGSGYYSMAGDQLDRYRRAVHDERSGAQLHSIVSELEGSGHRIGGIDALKSAPRGYPRDHPRIGLLRRKGLASFAAWEPAPWLHSPRVAAEVRGAWRAADPLNSWLDTHVGPSELPPAEWGR